MIGRKRPFTFTIKTDNAGVSSSNQFTVPTQSSGTYYSYVDWGDGSAVEVISTYNDARWTHTYSVAGTYTIKIYGTFIGLAFNNGGDKLKLLSITQWGIFRFLNNASIFYGCSNLVLTNVVDTLWTNAIGLLALFTGCSSLSLIPHLGKWDMSKVNRLQSAFQGCTNFNEPTIVDWDTRSLTTIPYMFFGASSFNQPIGVWNWSGYTTAALTGMFLDCVAFNQDLSNWGQYIKNTTGLSQFLQGSTLSKSNYNKLLSVWSGFTWGAITANFGNAHYDSSTGGYNGTAGRAILTGTYGMTITDGGTP